MVTLMDHGWHVRYATITSCICITRNALSGLRVYRHGVQDEGYQIIMYVQYRFSRRGGSLTLDLCQDLDPRRAHVWAAFITLRRCEGERDDQKLESELTCL